MTNKRLLAPSFFVRHAAVAVLSLGAAALAHAAPAGDQLRQAETKIHAGMSRDEVQGLLGRPSEMHRYGNLPGPTWTYLVALNGDQESVFDVDFGPNGTVATSEERLELLN